MWFLSSRKTRSANLVRRVSFRPRLEALEDRFLLSAGQLDTTFGSGGLVTTNFAKKSYDHAFAVAVQADGKIVAAGMDVTGGHFFAVARYNTNGTLDSSFGTGGKVLTQFDSSFGGSDSWGFVLQPDGKIVVGGTPFPSNGSSYELVRYNTNGTLDTSFGPNHTGIVLTSFPGATSAWVEGLAIESVNGSSKLVAGVYWHTTTDASHNDFAMARYNLDGTLDNSFGVGGEAVGPDWVASNAEVVTVATQADGKIILAGQAPLPNSGIPQFTLARYDTRGYLDPTFGNGGLVMLPAAAIGVHFGGDVKTVAIQADGKIVAAGTLGGGTGSLPILARFNTDGTLDGTFGSAGTVQPSSDIYGLVIQGNGRIVAAEAGVVARYNADGSVDTGFGSAGASTMPSSSNAYAVALQADGKIVAAGQSAYSHQTSDDFAVARFLGDPPLQALGGPAVHPATVAPLTQLQLQPILDEAIARWTAAGANPAVLHSVQAQVVDLSGGYLGLASGTTITLDRDAAGYGWFIDPTPHDDSEFTTRGDQGEQNRMDLLTAVMHELGHALGYEHEADGVMAETLAVGIRWSPTTAEILPAATPHALDWNAIAVALALDAELRRQR